MIMKQQQKEISSIVMMLPLPRMKHATTSKKDIITQTLHVKNRTRTTTTRSIGDAEVIHACSTAATALLMMTTTTFHTKIRSKQQS